MKEGDRWVIDDSYANMIWGPQYLDVVSSRACWVRSSRTCSNDSAEGGAQSVKIEPGDETAETSHTNAQTQTQDRRSYGARQNRTASTRNKETRKARLGARDARNGSNGETPTTSRRRQRRVEIESQGTGSRESSSTTASARMRKNDDHNAQRAFRAASSDDSKRGCDG